MRVTVIGTGYVGTVTGVCLAYLGHEVSCVDLDESKISRLQKGDIPIYEPFLAELLPLAALHGTSNSLAISPVRWRPATLSSSPSERLPNPPVKPTSATSKRRRGMSAPPWIPVAITWS